MSEGGDLELNVADTPDVLGVSDVDLLACLQLMNFVLLEPLLVVVESFNPFGVLIFLVTLLLVLDYHGYYAVDHGGGLKLRLPDVFPAHWADLVY